MHRAALTEYTDDKGKRSRFAYDRKGRVQSFTDGDGKTVTFERDQRGRIVRTISRNTSPSDPKTAKRWLEQKKNADAYRVITASYIQPAILDDPPMYALPPEYVYVIGYINSFYGGSGGGGSGIDSPLLEVGNNAYGGDVVTETYAQCLARRLKWCHERLHSDVTLTLAIGGVALAAEVAAVIIAEVLTAGVVSGTVAIAAILIALGIFTVSAFQLGKNFSDFNSCVQDIPDLCRGLPS